MSGIIGGAGSKSGVIGTTELDYEEGTWTPVLISGGNSISVTAGTATGYYVRVGNMCQFSIQYNNATLSGTTANNDTTISLPFTNAGNRTSTTLMMQYSGSYFNTQVQGDINTNDNKFYINKQPQPYAHATWTAIGSSTYWMIAGTYRVV